MNGALYVEIAIKSVVSAFRNKVVFFSVAVLFIITVLAIFPQIVTSVDPNGMKISNRFMPPSLNNIFGTDEFGRDVFSRVIYAGRVSLSVGGGVLLLSCLLGVFLGVLAGFFRPLDGPISRLLDAMMAFPDILLAIALVASLGPSLLNVVLALGITYAPRFARVVRGSTLVLRGLPFVEAARTMGIPTHIILFRHIISNLTSPILVQGTFVFATGILAEASLSFLGVGASPDMPTWGTMLSTGREFLSTSPWLMYAPGVFVVLTVLSLQLVGDGLRDMLDPRLMKEI